MRSYRKIFCFFLGYTLLFCGCLEPYDPPTSKSDESFLVVEGFLNATDGSATVKLSYSLPLSTPDAPTPETNALVTVKDDQENSYILNQQGAGVYSAMGIPFNMDRKYYVQITASGNKEYASDLITLKETPPIDSVTWEVDGKTVEISVNTHDPENNTRYYKWTFEETFEYTSKYNSLYVKTNEEPFYAPRPSAKSIYRCWKTQPNYATIIGNTSRLTDDVVRDQKVHTLQANSLELMHRYSILVKQYTLSEAGHTYWLNIQKTNEGLGGLFDPLPSQVVGNVRSLNNANERVIGYIGGGEVSEKRIFINSAELPDGFHAFDYPANCDLTEVLFEGLPTVRNPDALVAGHYTAPTNGPPSLIGFTTSSPHCIDCRIFGGGDIIKPEFWGK